MMKKLMILPMAMILLSCGDGKKAQTASVDETPEFEIVGKKEKEPTDTTSQPVSLSTILTGKEPTDNEGGNDGPSGHYEDPLGGDVNYLNGDDEGYDY